MEQNLFEFDFNFHEETKETEEKKVSALRSGKRHISRKALSEKHLEEVLPWHFEEGECWHYISMGDVDSFSYAKHIIKSDKIEYMMLSTWCMTEADVIEIENFLERGIIKHIDFYVGEIFEKSYALVFARLINLANKYGCRVCSFKNHSKVYILRSKTKSYVIESSANVNANSRTENTVITVDKELANFYQEFYNGIKNYNQPLDKKWKKHEMSGE